MTEHETTASLRRATPLRWWTILWAGALWMAAAVLLVSVAFGCSSGAETDGGQPGGGGAEAEAGEAAEPPAATRPEAEAAPDNAPPRTPWTVPPDDPARCAEARAEAEALAPAALDGYDGGETTLASAEWWELARAVSRAITGGGPGCSSEEGSAADAVADLRLRESEAVELARLEALEARRAEDADDQAAAEAAVERAWQEAGGGALSGDGGALSEPDQGQTTDPGPGSNPDRPGCQTDDNPVACWPPEVEGDPEGEIDGETGPDPEPEAGPDPEVEVEADPETPQSIVDFEDKAADVVRPAEPTRRQPDGPVLLEGPPVPLWTMADLLCPPEDVWRGRFYTGCGDPTAEGDYLRPHAEMRRCVLGPVELGIGDSYRLLAEGANPDWPDIAYYRNDSVIEVLGFERLDPAAVERWQAVGVEVRSSTAQRIEYADGEVVEETYTATFKPPSAWWQIGGPEHRGHNPGGSLAWGLFAIPGGECP